MTTPDVYHFERADARVLQYVYEIGSYHYNWHSAIEISVVLSGQVEFCNNGELHLLDVDDVMLVNSLEGHATLAKQPNSFVLLLRIEPRLLANFFGDPAALRFDCQTTPTTRYTPPFNQLRGLLAEMMLLSAETSPASRLRYHRDLLSVMYLLVSAFAPQAEPSAALTARRQQHESLTSLLAHIDANYTERITLESLGQLAGYNPTYISQLFSRELGISFLDYLTRIRLRAATIALGTNGRRIADIAVESGFPDVKAFNLAFRRSFGRTPSEYRREVTEAHQGIDSSFHKQFVPRSNKGVTSSLQALSAGIDTLADAHLAAQESQLETTRVRLTELSARLAAKASELAELRTEVDDLTEHLGTF